MTTESVESNGHIKLKRNIFNVQSDKKKLFDSTPLHSIKIQEVFKKKII